MERSKIDISECMIGVCILFLTLAIMGCGRPSGDPKEIAQKHLEALKSHRYEQAYDSLPTNIQKALSKEEFVAEEKIKQDLCPTGEIVLGEPYKIGDKTFSGTKYENVNRLPVKETYKNVINNGEVKSETYFVYVVNDNGNWKVFTENLEQPNKLMATRYYWLGYAYLYGKGKEMNFSEAIDTFKKSIQYDYSSETYRVLSGAYVRAGNKEDAIKSARTAVQIAGNYDKDQRSEALLALGMAYFFNGQLNEGKSALKEALSVNPNNESARKYLIGMGERL